MVKSVFFVLKGKYVELVDVKFLGSPPRDEPQGTNSETWAQIGTNIAQIFCKVSR